VYACFGIFFISNLTKVTLFYVTFGRPNSGGSSEPRIATQICSEVM
jgi:hypothetical protein